MFKKKFKKLFSLGNLFFTGKFEKKNSSIPKGKIEIVICTNCKLVQLNRNFNLKYMYNRDYGYRTGINKTMTEHMRNKVKKLKKISRLKQNDLVLDIASNDGTLLNFYGKKYIKIGIDPVIVKFKKFYKNIDYHSSSFFNYKIIKKLNIKKKFRVITALSVFYDLKNPNKFLSDIKRILDPGGIFCLEFTDLFSIIKKNMFDTFCHEHLEYYSVNVLNKMLKKNGLQIFDHEYNDINGGSSSFLICHKNSNFKINSKKIKKILNQEVKFGINNISLYKSFYKKICKIKYELKNRFKKYNLTNKKIHAYGASTKGNVLLQFMGLDNKNIEFVSDRNPEKWGLYTPGTKIKIIPENLSRKKFPDYYLVLPWHFKKEILKRESKIRRAGTKFIFPLPKIVVK